jgi:gluconolactonase
MMGINHHTGIILKAVLFILCLNSCSKNEDKESGGQVLESIVSNLQFAEGPAYLNGDLFFTDIDASKIYRWNETEGSQLYRENSGRANGLFFDKSGNLIVCEGGNKRIVSISPQSELNVISDKFSDKSYNEPNDVWISPGGNIYFTDPVFTGTLTQDGQHVYCCFPATGEVKRVAEDLVKPNGITGNKEGSILYIADYGSSVIFKYNIFPDGTLNNKQLFAAIGADGLDTDSNGNLYAASSGIMIYNSSGTLINTIQVPGTTTNLCIVEEGTRTIFITTHNTVYKYIIN